MKTILIVSCLIATASCNMDLMEMMPANIQEMAKVCMTELEISVEWLSTNCMDPNKFEHTCGCFAYCMAKATNLCDANNNLHIEEAMKLGKETLELLDVDITIDEIEKICRGCMKGLEDIEDNCVKYGKLSNCTMKEIMLFLGL